MPKKFLISSFVLFWITLGLLFFNFKRVEADISGFEVAAMKTRVDGNFYVPHLHPRPNSLSVERVFSDPKLEGDQFGWGGEPDGSIDMWDESFLSLSFFCLEGQNNPDTGATWNYMADFVVDAFPPIVDMREIALMAFNFDPNYVGTYLELTNLSIVFRDSNGNVLDPPGVVPVSGLVSIPYLTETFTVQKNGAPIGAHVKFYGVPFSNVFGWAWSGGIDANNPGIGWISFNKRNCDPDDDNKTEDNIPGDPNPAFPDCPAGQDISDYGVYIHSFYSDTIGDIVGRAWSDKLGWLDFHPTDFPPPTYPPYTARIDNTVSPSQLYGWARFLSYDKSYNTFDGWVKLSDHPEPTTAADKFIADPPTDSGGWLSLELVPPEFRDAGAVDNPVVSSFAGSGNNLRTVFCDNRFCEPGRNPQVGNPGDTCGDQGYTSSLALDKTGKPVISFVGYEDSEFRVKVRRCLKDAKCTSGETTINWIDPDNPRAFVTSIELDYSLGCSDRNLGCPMVAYGVQDCPTCNPGTYFIHCDDPYCDGDETSHRQEIADSPPAIDHGVDIEVDKKGNPVIVVQPQYSSRVSVIRCHNPECDSRDTYNLSFSGVFSELGWLDAELNFLLPTCRSEGCPVIFVTGKSGSTTTAGFLTCRNYDCTDNIVNPKWKTGFEPDSTALSFASVEITSGGYPVLLYKDKDDEELVLVRCLDFFCNRFTRLVLDEADKTAGEFTGNYADLELDSQDLPFVAYQRKTGNKIQLWFITCRNTGCEAYPIDYGLEFDKTTNKFLTGSKNFAWGSDVTGWMKTDASLEIHTPPDAELFEPKTDNPDYVCGVTDGPRVLFSWLYIGNSPPAKYRLEVSTDPTFYDPNQVVIRSCDYNDPPDDEGATCDIVEISDDSKYYFVNGSGYPLLSWGTPYYWRLQVWDEFGAGSGWLYAFPPDDRFTTPGHAYPAIDFNWDPHSPRINVSTEFFDLSKVETPNKKSCYWEFQNANIADYFTNDCENDRPVVEFLQSGLQRVKLTVTDEDDFSCPGYLYVPVVLPLPEWKEIPPF